MSAADPLTSVPIHTSTLRILREFKSGSQNWDRFLLDLLEREMDREDVLYARKVLGEYLAGKTQGVPLSRVRGTLGLPRRR